MGVGKGKREPESHYTSRCGINAEGVQIGQIRRVVRYRVGSIHHKGDYESGGLRKRGRFVSAS